MTGTPKVASSAVMTGGGSDAEELRTKRSRPAAMTSPKRGARSSSAWCMVGTAVYQVGRKSRSQVKNRNPLSPGVQTTDPPAATDASTAATRPWMWNSGMMLRQTSAGPSRSVWPICRAEAVRLAWVSVTILGRAVVPDVCSNSATSSAQAGPPMVGVASRGASRVNAPAADGSATSSMTGMPCAAATSRTGLCTPCWTISALTCRSDR
jgi:hypothetical protein